MKKDESCYIVVKLSDSNEPIPFHDKERLKERASGFWKIKLDTIGEHRDMLVMFKGQVIASFKIGNRITIDRDASRLKFELEEQDNNLIGKVLDYRTANPISRLAKSEAEQRIIEISERDYNG